MDGREGNVFPFPYLKCALSIPIVRPTGFLTGNWKWEFPALPMQTV